MNVKKELEKLQAIAASGKFTYKGGGYNVVDKFDKDNEQLKGRPLLRLTGVDTKGTEIRVWSHDVEAAEKTAYEATTEMINEVGVPVRVIKKKKKK